MIFYQKRHIFIFLVSFLYVFIIGRNVYKGQAFLVSLLPKYLKLFLPKETLSDTPIFLISISFIEIGLLSW